MAKGHIISELFAKSYIMVVSNANPQSKFYAYQDA